jgi:uncharacterized protein (DUF885 family)
MSGPGTIGGVQLTRPSPASEPGPLDERFYDLVEAHFRASIERHPVAATYLGIHAWDDRLDDPSRDRVLAEIAADRRHLATIEALDPAGLSPDARFERDLELHHLRLTLFEAERVRTWERRSQGASTIGDALFPLFARDFAPLGERLALITKRLEAAPAHLRAGHSRAAGPQVRAWQEVELAAARGLPGFLDVIRAAGDALPASERRHLARAADAVRAALVDEAAWIRGTLAGGTDEWQLGRERYDELIGLRAFNGLDSDAILAIGWDQLERNHADRARVAAELDSAASEAEVIDRLKSDHPATFEAALEGYRDAMRRARRHLIDRDLVTVPADERVEVMATPEYLRGVLPFAAYFEPAKWDTGAIGLYIVTPSVDGDPAAMREHYWASISNTSVHEAYPGHHLQLAIAARHPSLSRLQVDAPEFVEGWGMYCEQMMREEGFDDGPEFRVALATDAIWRACRIILDVRMHRGEVSIDEATDFLVEHTRFERPNAAAEARRYTATPTYVLSYLLGKVLILGLRDEERRRLGSAFSLRDFHDALLWGGSLPVSFHRRALRGEGRPAGPPGSAGSRAMPSSVARP